MVFVNLVAKIFCNKFVTRNSRHGGEHALVSDSASSELQPDHALALRSESIDLGFRGHGRRLRIANLHAKSRIIYPLHFWYHAFRTFEDRPLSEKERYA